MAKNIAGKILIIEDDTTLAKMYGERLSFENYEVIWAKNGETGMQAVITEKPDLVILDLFLPKKGGLGILRTMRSLPLTYRIPAIILTAYDKERYQTDAECYGAAQFLLKSETNPKVLARIVNSVLTLRKSKTDTDAWLLDGYKISK